MLKNFLSSITRNATSLTGTALALASVILIVCLFFMQQMGFDGGPYLGILTFLILVFSEIIPKTLGAHYWRQLAPATAHGLRSLVWLLWPFVKLSEFITSSRSTVPKSQKATARNMSSAVNGITYSTDPSMRNRPPTMTVSTTGDAPRNSNPRKVEKPPAK